MASDTETILHVIDINNRLYLCLDAFIKYGIILIISDNHIITYIY
jgi:hypothetical protein